MTSPEKHSLTGQSFLDVAVDLLIERNPHGPACADAVKRRTLLAEIYAEAEQRVVGDASVSEGKRRRLVNLRTAYNLSQLFCRDYEGEEPLAIYPFGILFHVPSNSAATTRYVRTWK